MVGPQSPSSKREPCDAGFTLIEVLVAMMIFAIVALGVGAALTSTLTIAKDSSSREAATSLAASEIATVRAIGDPFSVHDVAARSVTTAAGATFQVTRVTAWVTPTGAATTCGTGGGALEYKRVTVSVTWTGMRSATSPVISDTLLTPSTRINDATKGTILVSVQDSAGHGKAGVTFSIAPAVPGVTLLPTDSDGCSFVLQVPPGNYAVKLTNTGMIDYHQVANPTVAAQAVLMGSSTPYPFQYDTPATYNLNFASNISGARPLIPTNLDYTFINTYGVWTMPAASNRVLLHPYPSGYQAIAGKYSAVIPTCTSVDPEDWAPNTTVSPTRYGARAESKTAGPGLSVTIDVPMGGVTVTGGTSTIYLTAVSQAVAAVAGESLCGTAASPAMTYAFAGSRGTVQVALPYGSWRLYSSTSLGGTRTLLSVALTTISATGLHPDATGTFTLDPR